MSSTDDEGGEAGDLFAEPEGFYEAEKQPTFVTHITEEGKEVRLRLVGSSPLWVGDSSTSPSRSTDALLYLLWHIFLYGPRWKAIKRGKSAREG